jgi:uncharacterized protein YifE (UPF0438 family)
MNDFLTSLSPYLLILTEEQADFLRKYGPALDSLATGRTQPRTRLQRRFCSVVSGQEVPASPEEHLWLRLRDVRHRVQVLRTRQHEEFEVRYQRKIRMDELEFRIKLLEAELSECHLSIALASREQELASRTTAELQREIQSQKLDFTHQKERLELDLAECRRKSMEEEVRLESESVGDGTAETEWIPGERRPPSRKSACRYCGGLGGAGGYCPRCAGSGLR